MRWIQHAHTILIVIWCSIAALGISSLDFASQNLKRLWNKEADESSSSSNNQMFASLAEVEGILNDNSASLANRIAAWKFSAALYEDPQRQSTVVRMFETSKGIFKHSKIHSQKSFQSLHDVVLMTIVTYTHDFTTSQKQPLQGDYIPLLTNWLCFANTFRLKGVVYSLDLTDRHYSSAEAFLKQRVDVMKAHHVLERLVKIASGHRFDVLQYPESLFWSLLTNKTAMAPKHLYPPRANYLGTVPNFRKHGAIAMLVPWLEAMMHEYSLVFLDVDVALVRDPVPWLSFAAQRVDVAISKEIRECRLPDHPSRLQRLGRLGLDGGGDHMTEPNTGVSFMKHRVSVMRFFRDWLNRLIDENIMNDQKALVLDNLRLHYTDACNPRSLHFTSQHLHHQSNDSVNSLSLCLLDEYHFQNGMVALHCAKDKHHGERAEYVQGMEAALHSPFPVLVHVNYVGQKKTALIEAGLWLSRNVDLSPFALLADQELQSNVTVDSLCFRYVPPVGDEYSNVGTTLHYLGPGFTTWAAEVQWAEEFIKHELQLPPNGTLVQFPNERDTFVMLNGAKRRIVGDDTIAALGLNESTPIILLGLPMLRDVIPAGPELRLSKDQR